MNSKSKNSIHSSLPTHNLAQKGVQAAQNNQWPLWEVFMQPKSGAHHAHVGSVHAPDAEMALQNARDVYTRREEGTCIWVVPAELIVSSQPEDQSSFFDPANDKIYRHPNFYILPKEVKNL